MHILVSINLTNNKYLSIYLSVNRFDYVSVDFHFPCWAECQADSQTGAGSQNIRADSVQAAILLGDQ